MTLEKFIEIVTPYTMTSVERITSLYESLEYIRNNNIDGDIVECGVWKGGNILGCMEYLNYYKINKKVYLYDTFSGMTDAQDFDKSHDGDSGSNWVGRCDCDIDEVKSNLSKSKYPKKNIKFIQGDVLNTLDKKENLPSKISLLRLDTDWYESTKKEMNVLYPLLVNNGVLLVDDYGHWEGSKKAVDEYFSENGLDFNFEKIDYTCIKFVK
jgi:hypothetical protein